jgi:hypothetical protein
MSPALYFPDDGPKRIGKRTIVDTTTTATAFQNTDIRIMVARRSEIANDIEGATLTKQISTVP